MTDDFLQEVAQHYLKNVNSGDKKRPLAYVAEQYGAPKQTVRKWVKLSKQRGFLPELGQGRAWICDVTANKLAIQRVRELHKQVTQDNAACGDIDCCGEYEQYEECADCQCEYPCPTIKALDGDPS